MKKEFILIILLTCFVICGCATSNQNLYSVRGIPPLHNERFANKILLVQEFKDVRLPESERFQFTRKSILFFTEADAVKRNGKKWYVNSQKIYRQYLKSEKLSPFITRTIAAHLSATKLFQEVKVKQTDRTLDAADFLLQGNLSKFEALQESSTATKIGIFFSLIGMLITAPVETVYESSTVLSDIQLIDAKTKEVVWQGEISTPIVGERYMDPFGYAVYERANESLKQAINKMASELAKVH